MYQLEGDRFIRRSARAHAMGEADEKIAPDLLYPCLRRDWYRFWILNFI